MSNASDATSPDVVREAREAFSRLKAEIHKVIVGQDTVVDQMLTAIFCRGHVVVVGVPGLAKTLLISTIARTLSLGFSRIQFTPDLMPSDITGTEVMQEDKASGQRILKFVRGPIFSNVILADEINRTPPKTQAALLEAMQERQVTIGDQTYKLPDPFLVLATQNPLEQEGTYSLPEAQLDRFMLKLTVGYPTRAEERLILDLMGTSAPKVEVAPVIDPKDIVAARALVNEVFVDDRVKDYIISLVFATREPASFGIKGLDGMLRYGASPRATIALTLAAKARAFLAGRGYVTPHDVKSVAPDVLRHRILISYEAEAEDMTSETIIGKLLHHLPVP
jgi:MoxR-like ATPase